MIYIFFNIELTKPDYRIKYSIQCDSKKNIVQSSQSNWKLSRTNESQNLQDNTFGVMYEIQTGKLCFLIWVNQ